MLRRLSGIAVLGMLLVTAGQLSGQTVTAFKTGEQTTGMTKQCFYEALGSVYTRTINSVALCPLSIQVTLGGRFYPASSAPN
jgi:hypothetical protein